MSRRDSDNERNVISTMNAGPSGIWGYEPTTGMIVETSLDSNLRYLRLRYEIDVEVTLDYFICLSSCTFDVNLHDSGTISDTSNKSETHRGESRRHRKFWRQKKGRENSREHRKFQSPRRKKGESCKKNVMCTS